METVLQQYQDLNPILCSKPLDYIKNSIVTDSRPLKEALDLDLIGEFQEFSPPVDDIPIEDFLNNKDLVYMKRQITSGFEWKTDNLPMEIDSCENNSDTIRLKFSEPLFNKEIDVGLVFLEQSSVADYSVSLILLKKEKGSWIWVWSLNM